MYYVHSHIAWMKNTWKNRSYAKIKGMIYIRILEQLYLLFAESYCCEIYLFKRNIGKCSHNWEHKIRYFVQKHKIVPSQTNLLIKLGNHNQLLAQLLLLAVVISSNLCDILSHIAFSCSLVTHCNRFCSLDYNHVMPCHTQKVAVFTLHCFIF